MKAYIVPVLLQLAGIAVIIAEIILPSGGLLSVLAIGILGYSLYAVFHDISTSAGVAFVIADILMIPVVVVIGLKMLAKSPVTLRTELSSAEGVTSQSPELMKYIDKIGTAVTDLHPAGTALIEGKRVDVVSRGEYIEKNSALEVIAVKGNQVVVRQIDDK